MGEVKRRLIAGTINYQHPEEGWANVHMDKSDRPLWDVDENMSRPPEVVWDVTNLLGSPVDDYDEIRCWQTLEHIDPKRAELAIQGFFRILKPGGVLDIETPNLDAIFAEWGGDEHDKDSLLNGIYGTPNHEMFQDSVYMLHVTGYWPERMEALLKDAGFEPNQQDTGNLQLRYRAVKPEAKPATRIYEEGIRQMSGKTEEEKDRIADETAKKAQATRKAAPKKKGGKS